MTISEVIASGLASVAVWMIYDLIREFKTFKKEAGQDIITLKNERNRFESTVRNVEVSFRMEAVKIEKVHLDFSSSVKSELKDIREISTDITKNMKNFDRFMVKSFQVSKALHERLKSQEEEIVSLKIKLKDMMIIRGKSQ